MADTTGGALVTTKEALLACRQTKAKEKEAHEKALALQSIGCPPCEKCDKHPKCPKCRDCPKCRNDCPVCPPPCPDAKPYPQVMSSAHQQYLNGGGGGGGKKLLEVAEGTNWKGLERLDSMAAHEILLPNFPPRKGNNPKGALLLTRGGPREEFFPPPPPPAGGSPGAKAGRGNRTRSLSSSPGRRLAGLGVSNKGGEKGKGGGKDDDEENEEGEGADAVDDEAHEEEEEEEDEGDDDGGFEGGVSEWSSTPLARYQAGLALSACDEVNVVVSKGDGRVCLAVLEAYDAPPYHVFRLRRRGKTAPDSGVGGAKTASANKPSAAPPAQGRTRGGKQGSSSGGGGGDGAVAVTKQWVHAARYENAQGRMPAVPENLDGPVMRKMGTASSSSGGGGGGGGGVGDGGGRSSPPPSVSKGSNASALLLNFLNSRPAMDEELRPLVMRLAANAAHPRDQPLPRVPSSSSGEDKQQQQQSQKKKNGGGKGGAAATPALGPVVVLAVNAGVLDLVLNFLCSAQRQGIGGHGFGGDLFQSMLVFAADDEVETAMKSVGVATFRHHGLGSFPKASAYGYGDDIFTSLMWLKVVSVYAVLRLGVDVLFQDADVVWWRDPRPFFTDRVSARPDDDDTAASVGQSKAGGGGSLGLAAQEPYDAYFQNDGARSQRYSPFSANTGFYYLRSNPKARLLMHDLLHSYNLISQWKSHQHVLCQLLVEHYSKTGLSVDILPHRLFSIGQQYHRKKDFMRSLVANTASPRPFVFHWSWTAGKHEKLAYSAETGMWYLNPGCSEASIRKHAGDAATLRTCCVLKPAPSGSNNTSKTSATKSSSEIEGGGESKGSGGTTHPYLALSKLPEWATEAA